MMRVAVCLSGEMRGCSLSLERLRTHVIEPFQSYGATVDLFCHTRKDPWWGGALESCVLGFRGLWVEENRWRDPTPIISKANPVELGQNEGASGRRAFLYQSYLQQYESLHAVGQMKQRAERQDGAEYNLVVRTRPDCYLEAPLPVGDLKSGTVNFPWNDWWPYEMDGVRVETLTDKFAVGPSFMMDDYFNKLNWLKNFCSSYKIQGEAFTAWQLRQLGHPYVRHEGMKIHQSDLKYQYSHRPDKDYQ